MILTVKTRDTILTSKGTTSIPMAIRQAAGLFPGSRIAWDYEGGEIRARRREGGAGLDLAEDATLNLHPASDS
jgi:bifunctional DNA-binding transcriptional regulator/antitoxin component of YhaV-PrlF toxin-antitoxin module